MVLPIFGSNTAAAHWQPDPDGRGTSSLLQTCLITLGLCIYSAIHLNIPRHRASKKDKALAKFTWLVIALFAPEFVVFTAWTQRRDAIAILAALRKAHGNPGPEPLRKRIWKWLHTSNLESDKSAATVSLDFP